MSRLLNFPLSRSLGELIIQRPPAVTPITRTPARGLVKVSAGCTAALICTQRVDLTALTSLDPDSLDRIHLEHRAYSDDDTEPISALTALRAFIAPGTKIGDITIARLQSFRDLLRLNASNTRITDNGLGYLSASITELLVAGPMISDQGVARMQHLERVELVDLTASRITDGSLDLITRKPIRYLSLDRTTISDEGIQHLSRAPRLRVLRLQRTSVSAKGLAKALPDSGPIEVSVNEGIEDDLRRLRPDLIVNGIRRAASAD